MSAIDDHIGDRADHLVDRVCERAAAITTLSNMPCRTPPREAGARDTIPNDNGRAHHH